MTTYTTTGTTLVNGITLSSGESPAPARAPKGLIATRAVQTKAGWVGQVVVAEEIIWESEVEEYADAAEESATAFVIDKIKGLLGAAAADESSE